MFNAMLFDTGLLGQGHASANITASFLGFPWVHNATIGVDSPVLSILLQGCAEDRVIRSELLGICSCRLNIHLTERPG